MTTIPNNTVASVDDVKRLVAAAFNAINTKDNDRKDAREVFTDAAQAATGERETLLTKIAGAAHAQAWDGILTEQGIDAAKAARNNQKDASINTFAAEIKRACHPSVRKHVKGFFQLAADAWDAEKDADDKPLRKAFARKYHMVVNTMFNAAIAGAPIETEQGLADAALSVIRERERDYTKVYSRLQAIKDQLAKFASDFPVEGISACVEFLGEVTKDELKECVKPSPKVIEPVAAPQPESDEPVDGASDILAEINEDLRAA